MAITVRADVKDGEQAVSVTQEIRPLLKDIEARLPSGYRIDVGGAVEESDKANKALAAVAPVMRFTVYAVSAGEFAQWVERAKNAGPVLDAAAYADLTTPSGAVPAFRFRAVGPGLFSAIVMAGQ